MKSRTATPRRFGVRSIFLLMAASILIYVTTMMIVRLEITSMAYDFDQVKTNERALREEQLRLQAEISRALADSRQRKIWRDQGFEEPSPKQVVIIP